MLDPTIGPKILDFCQSALIKDLPHWHSQLLEGDLWGVEQSLFTRLTDLFNRVLEWLLPAAAEALRRPLRSAVGGKKTDRPLSIRVLSGHTIQVQSSYLKVAPKGQQGSRHLLARHWQLIGGASPGLYDRVGFLSMLAPSYELAHQALRKFGVTIGCSAVRKLTGQLGEASRQRGEEHLISERGEDVAGKRVVVSVDGGRCRLREYSGAVNAHGQAEYDTPWREPKLFVVDVLDEGGRPSRYELPMYGCRFSDVNLTLLLGRYLQRLRIDQATHVQIIADGAPWIWQQIPDLLMSLGVKAQNITQTLDYYHAVGYVHQLVQAMPQRIGQRERKMLLASFKDQLWQGQAGEIVAKCRQLFLRPHQDVKRYLAYFEKHTGRTQYAHYQRQKLLCGSGLMESAVRRVINLRFKSASMFWQQEGVERLFFLKSALVAGRWNILMQNLASST